MKTTNESPLGMYRKNATIAGGLLIIGTVAGVISATTGLPIWSAPDYLSRLSANQNLINLGITLQFIMAIACAGVSLALYPILKQFSAGLAIGSVGFRLMENTFQILKAVSMVALLAISQEFVKAGSPDAAYLQDAAAIITAASDWMVHGAALICFCIGASLYYIVFYQQRLVPRWLSAWGVVSLILTVIASLLVMNGIIPGFGIMQGIANLSILVQEMVFAVWLIGKGVNSSVVATAPTNPKLDLAPLPTNL